MMMNFVALGLLATSLAICGVWSPSPEPHHRLRRDELLREGHRVIVVEYERHVPVGEPRAREEPAHHSATKDKICDAYGVCRDTLYSLLGNTKDKLSEAEHIAQDKVARVKEGAEDAISKAKGKVAQLREGAEDAAKSAEERATDAAERVVDKAEGAKDALKDAVGAVKEKVRDAAANASASAAGKAEAAEHVTRRNLSYVARRARDVAQRARDVARRARDVARDAVACACAWAPGAGLAAAGVAHLVAAAAAYGTCVWVTFVSSHVLAAALPRQQFGLVQSKLYPVYFRAVACCVGAALLAQLLGRDRRVAAERVQGYNLLATLALVLVNMLFLEPKATKVMFKRMKLEKEEGRGRDIADMVEPATTTAGSPTTAAAAAAAAATATSAVPRNPAKGTMADPETMKSRITKLNKRLKQLNNYSSTLNIVTMMGLSWHLVHLAHQLQMQR